MVLSFTHTFIIEPVKTPVIITELKDYFQKEMVDTLCSAKMCQPFNLMSGAGSRTRTGTEY